MNWPIRVTLDVVACIKFRGRAYDGRPLLPWLRKVSSFYPEVADNKVIVPRTVR